jgi:drug/metabolite transporter (DMT)-like permease
VVSIALALAAAGAWGTMDFLGGIAARRTNAFLTVVTARIGGLLLLVPLLLARPFAFDASTLLWGLVTGLAGVLGITVFFYALTRGSMTVVSPVSAVVAVGVPVLVGLALGERPHLLADAGILVGTGAVLLVGWAEGGGPKESNGLTVIGLALLSGVLAGLFNVGLSRGRPGSEILMLATFWISSLPIALVMLITSRAYWRPSPLPTTIAMLVGILAILGGLSYQLAVHQKGLILVSVLASLYPVMTIILSLAILRERVRHRQFIGSGLALVAIALIAIG